MTIEEVTQQRDDAIYHMKALMSPEMGPARWRFVTDEAEKFLRTVEQSQSAKSVVEGV